MNNYAIFGYDSLNIGDDIQSLISSKIFNISYFILRDNFDRCFDFETGKEIEYPKETINLIANGWYILDYKGEYTSSDGNTKFPFERNKLNPLYVSCSFPEYNKHLYSKKAIKHLKERQPILARDKDTHNLLINHGVESEFFGCITMLLEKEDIDLSLVDEDFRGANVYVDCHYEYLNKNLDKSKNNLVISHYDYEWDEDNPIVKNQKELINLNPKERINKAEKLLSSYTIANKIFTSRLHCYLPCKAMGLDVYYVGERCYRTESLIDIENIDKKKKRAELIEFVESRKV